MKQLRLSSRKRYVPAYVPWNIG